MTGERILVVEDHPITALHESDVLQDLGYDVTGIVYTGEAAIRRAGEDKPDVVLMDIQLIDDMDGLEAAQEIRYRYGTPVVFVTAGLIKKQLKTTVAPQGYGLVIKPFTKAELSEAIERVLALA